MRQVHSAVAIAVGERSLMEALLDFAEDINETSRNRDFLVWRHKINP
jgi:uridine phosphorylase